MLENNVRIRIVVVVAFLVALAGIGVVLSAVQGDEPPIRVRNGSMDVELVGGTWVDNGDAWSPSNGAAGGRYFVKVLGGTGFSCDSNVTIGSGNVVSVSYSDGVTIRFTPASGRTGVRPKSDLSRANPATLRHGSAGAGHISEVRVVGPGTPLRCSFPTTGALSEIRICPAQNAFCQ
jgi:hypothetical protein